MKLPVAMKSVRLGSMHAVLIAKLFECGRRGPCGVQRGSTPAIMSMIGFAARPGTDVEPM